MKNSFYIIFLTILIFGSAKAENLKIESKTISVDKDNKLAVFKDEVVAQDDKNILKAEYAEYSKRIASSYKQRRYSYRNI